MTEDEDLGPGGVYDPRDALPVEGPVAVESYDPELDRPVRVVRVPARALATVGVLLLLTVVGVGFAHRGHGVTAPVAASASTGGGLPPLFITPTVATTPAGFHSPSPASMKATVTFIGTATTRVTSQVTTRVTVYAVTTRYRAVIHTATVTVRVVQPVRVTVTRTITATITRRVR